MTTEAPEKPRTHSGPKAVPDATPNGGAPEHELPGDGEAKGDPGEAQEVTQLSIEGDADLTSKVGGRKPDEAVIVLQGGQIKMGKSQFDKDTRVRLVVEGYLDEVATKNHRDAKTGQIHATKKRHVLRIDHMEKVPLLDEGAGA